MASRGTRPLPPASATGSAAMGASATLDRTGRSCEAYLMPDLVGNKAIETAAIEWVMELERVAGREPRDTRYAGAPADIESPPRLIEVKAFGKSNRGFELWLETRQLDQARRNPDCFVYVVENV